MAKQNEEAATSNGDVDLKLSKPYSYQEASKFFTKIPKALYPILESHTGGTFTAASFNGIVANTTEGEFSGIMFWFCFDPDTATIYLALEGRYGFTYPYNDPAKVAALTPVPGNLWRPTQFFGREIEGVPDFEKWLREHQVTAPQKDKEVDHITVLEHVSSYLTHPSIKRYQKYGHAYFENTKDEITSFLNQAPVAFVRYYFGYDPIDNPNYIRVVLVPVDAQGNAIQEKQGSMAGADTLQKSVPPPPEN